MKSKVFRKKRFLVIITGFLMLLISACSGSGGGGDYSGGHHLDIGPVQTFGVVALSTVGSIGILDGNTQTLTAVHLTGELGTYGGGLFDVAITPDGKTTLVSNFGDGKVYFINTTNPAAPAVSGSVTLDYLLPALGTMYAEDMAITPDGRYALVTDGGMSPRIFVIDIATRTVVDIFLSAENTTDPLNPWTPQHQSVAVAADGVTVLTADYNKKMVHVHTLSSTGHLTYVSSIDVSNPVWDPVALVFVKTLAPVNLEISPDGRTVIVASSTDYTWKDDAQTIHADAAFPVLNITAPGVVARTGYVEIPATILKSCQSVVFNRAGTKAYSMCTQPVPVPDPVILDPLYPGPKNVIQVLNVTAPGTVSDAGTRIEVEIYGNSQLFGVDTLAMDNVGQYLYVSNPTLSRPYTGTPLNNRIQIVDVTTNTVVKTITFDPLTVGDPPAPPVLTDSIPTGISFWHN